MSTKVCPMKDNNPQRQDPNELFCDGEYCQWWVKKLAHDNSVMWEACAIEAIALEMMAELSLVRRKEAGDEKSPL